MFRGSSVFGAGVIGDSVMGAKVDGTGAEEAGVTSLVFREPECNKLLRYKLLS